MTTLVTAANIAQLRRLVNEPTSTTYSDADLVGMLEQFPLMDELGTEPYYFDYTTEPPTRVANTDWVPTYDLNAVAADIWAEKANVVSVDFNFSADGGNYTRSQVFDQFMKQSRYYASRRSPAVVRLRPYPRPFPGAIDEDEDWP